MVKIFKRGEEFQIINSDNTDVWGKWLFFYIGKYLKKEVKMIPFFYSYDDFSSPKTKLIRVYKGGDAEKVAKYIVKLLEKEEIDERCIKNNWMG